MFLRKSNTKLPSQKEQKFEPITINQAIKALEMTPFQDSLYAYQVLSDAFQRINNGEKVDFNKLTTIEPFTSIYKKTPYLDMAIHYFPREAFQYLIENGAKMKKDIIHDIIRYQSCYHYQYDELDNLIKFIRSHDADLNAVDDDSHSALYNVKMLMRNDKMAQDYINILSKYGSKLTLSESMCDFFELKSRSKP